MNVITIGKMNSPAVIIPGIFDFAFACGSKEIVLPWMRTGALPPLK